MGGAVVTEVAVQKAIPLRGVAVLDVVEGTAIDSLPFMQQFIRSRPLQFKSLDAGIQWALRQGAVHNKEAAQVSVPSQLMPIDDPNGLSASKFYVWRTDLLTSEPHWEGWFSGLSEKFLKVPGGRLLVLAGTERLDKPMTIGQMQGKFQMLIFPESGHLIQEDSPEKLADAMMEFWKRNQPLVIKKFPIPPLHKPS